MEIRALAESDATAWWEIRRESLERDPLAFGKTLEEHRAMTPEATQERFRTTPEGGFHLGAFDGARLIGIATFLRDAGLKERHKGRIYGVYVSAPYRRKGVARALLATLIERARQDATLEQILLAVAAPQEAARLLYANLGFQTYGTEPRALKSGSTYVDEDHMILRLS